MAKVDTKESVKQEVKPRDITERLVEMWLHGLSPQTTERYRRTSRRFLDFVNKPLHLVTLADLQGWQMTLLDLSPSSQRTALATIKSLLSFGHKIGVLSENVGLSMRSPKAKDCLIERILSESDVRSMIAMETNPRNRIILLLLYSSGLRVSELCQLKWKDLKPRGDSGQVTVLGMRKFGTKRTTLKRDAQTQINVCTNMYRVVRFVQVPCKGRTQQNLMNEIPDDFPLETVTRWGEKQDIRHKRLKRFWMLCGIRAAIALLLKQQGYRKPPTTAGSKNIENFESLSPKQSLNTEKIAQMYCGSRLNGVLKITYLVG